MRFAKNSINQSAAPLRITQSRNLNGFATKYKLQRIKTRLSKINQLEDTAARGSLSGGKL